VLKRLHIADWSLKWRTRLLRARLGMLTEVTAPLRSRLGYGGELRRCLGAVRGYGGGCEGVMERCNLARGAEV
jgi:hypothetical protein